MKCEDQKCHAVATAANMFLHSSGKWVTRRYCNDHAQSNWGALRLKYPRATGYPIAKGIGEFSFS